MPAIHSATFRVRHYECDAYGHLNNANYARYMEEAAFEASAAVGYDQPRYEEIGTLWLARETEIEYLLPLRYRDEVMVKTWVDDFRRVRSRRRYEFYRQGDLVAKASTDWVYLDRHTMRPLSVPPEMVRAFAPEGMPDNPTPRSHFPTPPPPPPGAFIMRRRVEWRDIDTAQHVNNAAYLNYIEDCGIQVANAFGWPLARIHQEGFAIIARKHHIEYRTQARLDDELELTTWVSDGRRSTAIRHYTIHHAGTGELVAQASTLWVWVDVQTMRPIRIPAHFMEDFAANIVP
ncbi:MAG: acyl-CoA thioesterase [Chloroflexi bacterium]|nr:acyl-CoA thioesterase [Chloroflexota bacterium]